MYLAIFGYNLIPVVRLHVTFVSRTRGEPMAHSILVSLAHL